MRLSLITLMIVAAFTLGLLMGGQAPREAAAQNTSVGGINWSIDGTSLTLINTSETQAFAVVGWQGDGEKPQILTPRSHGKLVVATGGLENVTVYKLEGVMACNPRQCVLCDERSGGSHCPIPGWPPRGNEFVNITGPTSWGR